MTSVLSYPTSDPFSSSITDAASHHSRPDENTPPVVAQRHRASAHAASYTSSHIPSVTMSTGSRGSNSPFAPPMDEFGAVRAQHTSQRPRTSAGPTTNLMPLAPSQPTASTSTAHASSHSHTATPANASSAAQRQRNRQSHNPSATLGNLNPSPPRAEHLSDEYVLHPSVYAYKQAHPRRPMVAFGPYVLLQTLGEGEFGKVKLGVHTEYGVQVAIKLIRRGSLDDEVRASKVEREIDVLKSLKHPNIVRMFDVIDTEKYIGIVLEMAGGGELFDHILASRYLKERDAQKLFAQLISGVDYLHKKHIVHRDLKLENLLLDKHRNIIITDFGFANRFEHAADDLMATSCGSPCYAAPELVVSEGLYVGSAVDIWSCGVILYAMLSGYLPYDDDPSNPDGDNINLLYKYIMNTRLNFPEQMSPEAKNLLQMMLVPNPELRCTVQAIMEHPWLSQYTDLFYRTPADHEYIFQETMYHKSQQAKRELADRRRIQEEAKVYKSMQRSQSSAPGASVTAGMLDQNRRRDQRHQSAMPTLSGTATMPMHLNNAGTRTPPLSTLSSSTPTEIPVTASAPPTMFVTPTPLPVVSADVAETQTFAIPEPVLQPISSEDDGRPSKPTLVSHTSETPTPSTTAVENEPLDSAPATRPTTPPPHPDTEKKEPMSANKNRHTIQVEYDVDASYERMQESMAERGSPKARTGALEASTMDLQPVTSDIEMDSGSENDHRTEESIMERISPDPSRMATPPIVIAPIPELEPAVPTTPTKTSAALPTSPTTPRASATFSESEANMLTPRQKAPENNTTPRAPVQPIGTKRRESMPPSAVLDAPTNGLSSSGLPMAPAKRDRSKKGMSLDKFGLARLLGQVRASDDKSVPPSAFGQTGSHVKRGSISRPSTSAGEAKSDMKTKRMTMQSLSDRSSTNQRQRPQTASITSTGSARDKNPSISPKAVPAPPRVSETQVHQPHGQSSPSIVTVDAMSTQQAAAPKDNKHASSGPAKKVMGWFRRKSLAKDTSSNIKTSHLRSDSTSSFVRVSDSPARPSQTIERGSTANVAMSSTTSVAPAADQTPIAPVVETTPKNAAEPLQPAVKVNIVKGQGEASTASRATKPPAGLMLPPGAASSTASVPRSMSHNVPPATAPIPSTATFGAPAPRANSRPMPPSRSDDSKLKIHTGFVNQSALSNKPPKEIIEEVLRILQDMGMEVKRENDFRFRCTRVRKRKAGATTGLGLGSVMSVGSGMGSFSLMGNASTNKVDSRGLPMPQSPSIGGISGGLKGMLLRRGSSYSSSTHLPRSDSALSETNLNSPRMSSPPAPTKETIYGPHSMDTGDEIKFNVELCRLKNLSGLYILHVNRVRGNAWSYKFIYQTIIERCETLTH